MTKWLLSVLKELQKVPLDPTIDNGRRMTSVLTIILCFDFLIPQYIKMKDIPSDDIAGMMSMLVLQPDLEKKKCHDLDFFKNLVHLDVKKGLTDAVVSFCNELLHQTYLNQPIWLYAVPLIHFLQGACQPFEKPEQDPNKIMWPDSSSLGLHALRQKTYTGKAR